VKVLVSGSTGLVGSALVARLAMEGHGVVRLVRTQPRPGQAEIFWNPQVNTLNTARLEDFDAVVHLAGENIAAGRWTAKRKAAIRDSRVGGTRFLCQSLWQLSHPPRVLVCASAVGYYGDRGDQELVEIDEPGKGFLAEVAQAWERTTVPAVEKGIRVVQTRFGMVLSPAGGALARMLPPFRMGLGGRVGSGQQYVSWISLDDAVGAIDHALKTETLSGPVNAVAPHPVTNEEFARTLGRVLECSPRLSLPAFVAQLVLGEMADELLLASVRAKPARLLDTGYEFLHPELEGALRHLLS